jgi:hypothetical protein
VPLATDADGALLAGGRIVTTPISQGQSIEYAMLARRKDDPNATDFREELFLTRTVIVCVLKQSTDESWYSDHTIPRLGGTFAQIRFFTKRPVALIVQLAPTPAILSKDALPIVPGRAFRPARRALSPIIATAML